ncbi:hypothetical protein BASA81_001569 [Batrachochytrium salamandrivorans]|nr:hypothetical protein BASA81_001569 [Batrachochytrium salamandrivorans]
MAGEGARKRGGGGAAAGAGPEESDSRKRVRAAPEFPDECGICFESDFEHRGKLNSCMHGYCYSCILKWSKSSTTCPQCKQRFTTIKKLVAATGKEVASVSCKRTDLGGQGNNHHSVIGQANLQALLAHNQAFSGFMLTNAGLMDLNFDEDDDEDDEDYDEEEGAYYDAMDWLLHPLLLNTPFHHLDNDDDDDDDDEDDDDDYDEDEDEFDEDDDEEATMSSFCSRCNLLISDCACEPAQPLIQHGAGTADEPFQLVDSDDDD